MPVPPFSASAPMRLYESSLCPLTNGNETRITAAGKEKICQRHRGERLRCKTCSGDNLPEELTIIDIKEPDMATQQIRPGTCVVCGQQKNVKTVRDGKCCSTCAHIYHAVHGKRDMLLGLLLKVHGPEYVASYSDENFPPASGILEIERLREENAQLREQLVASENQQCGVCTEAHNTEIANLEAELERAKERIACNLCTDRDHTTSRDTVVLDIALKVISGEVQGITAATLVALR